MDCLNLCEADELCLATQEFLNQLRKDGHVHPGDIIDAHVGLIRIRDLEVLGEMAADVYTHKNVPKT